jgi:hypothetical protein
MSETKPETSSFEVSEEEQERFERLTGEGNDGVGSPDAPEKREGKARDKADTSDGTKPGRDQEPRPNDHLPNR